MFLIAGERRLRAIELLHSRGQPFKYGETVIPPGQIPYHLLSELAPDDALEVELHENIIRVDLTWQERAETTERLHELRKKRNPSHSIEKTSIELGVSSFPVMKQLLLARNLHHPEVAKATSEADALKQLRKIQERELSVALAEQISSDDLGVDLREGDAIELMQTLPNESVEIILTDPPYGIDAGKHRLGTDNKHTYDDSWETVWALMGKFAAESFRVAKLQAHIYLFCDLVHFNAIRDCFAKVGWYVWNHPYIWVKDEGGVPDATIGPRHDYECILYAVKGNRAVNKLTSDVLTFPIVRDKVHAAQKPVELYEHLLSISAVPGDTVLDPFCGSGTIFFAARAMNLTAIGFDSDPTAIANAKQRLLGEDE